VPGLCRVYPYYGVSLPEDVVVQDLVRLSQNGPVHLSRHLAGHKHASEIEDRLLQYQRDGQLGVMSLEPALHAEVLNERLHQTDYADQVARLKRQKYARYEQFKLYLASRHTCRSHQLQLYFDGQGEPCGSCDVCAPRKPAPWDGVSVNLDDLWNPRKELLRLLSYFEKYRHTVGKDKLARVLRNDPFLGRQDNGTQGKPFHWVEQDAPNLGKLRFLEAKTIQDELGVLCRQGHAAVEERIFRAGSQAMPVVVLTEQGRQEAKRWTRS